MQNLLGFKKTYFQNFENLRTQLHDWELHGLSAVRSLSGNGLRRASYWALCMKWYIVQMMNWKLDTVEKKTSVANYLVLHRFGTVCYSFSSGSVARPAVYAVCRILC